MLPRAHIVHQLRGRLRLRIREKRQEPEYFEELLNRLQSVTGVSEVRVNQTTGSLLLLHPELPYAELEAQLNELELFEIVATPEAKGSALNPVFAGFSWLDQAISEESIGHFDLRSLVFIGLVGLAAHQMYRGNITVPAIPLLLSALSLADQIKRPSSETDQ
ncbi:MAG: HMA2 domain-containing protein [Pseudomonadota bacterium]